MKEFLPEGFWPLLGLASTYIAVRSVFFITLFFGMHRLFGGWRKISPVEYRREQLVDELRIPRRMLPI